MRELYGIRELRELYELYAYLRAENFVCRRKA